MNLKTLLEDQNRFIIKQLDLVSRQGRETPTETRRFEISRVTELISMHFRLEQRYLYPVLYKNPETRPLLEKIKSDTEGVLALLEIVPMMHMDEPDLRTSLAELRQKFSTYARENEETFFSHLCDNLSDEQCDMVAGDINRQVTHDLLMQPSFIQ